MNFALATRQLAVRAVPAPVKQLVTHPAFAPAAFWSVSAAGVGSAAYLAATTPNGEKQLGHGRDFWKGLGVGVVGAIGIKYGYRGLGKLGAIQGAKNGVRALTPAPIKEWSAARSIAKEAAPPPTVKARIFKGLGVAAGVTLLGTAPSYGLLWATRDDRKLLGQGHEFWTGAVWGLAGVATLKTALSGSEFTKHAPLATGWVASDFAALGASALFNGGSSKH